MTYSNKMFVRQLPGHYEEGYEKEGHFKELRSSGNLFLIKPSGTDTGFFQGGGEAREKFRSPSLK